MNDALTRAYTVLADELTKWFDLLVRSLPNLILATVVLAVFWSVASVFQRATTRVLHRTDVNRMLVTLSSRAVRGFVLGIGLFLALGILDLQKTVTSLLAGAGVLGLVLGLAFQDFMSNFFASVLISVRRPFGEGDIIQTGTHMGVVDRVNFRNTVIKNFDGQQVLVPNKNVIEETMLNYTRYGTRRINLDIDVAYDVDLSEVGQIAVNAVRTLPEVLRIPEPVAQYSEFNESGIRFQLRFWISYPASNFFEVRSQAVVAVHRAFAEKHVRFSFPIRVVELSTTPLPAAHYQTPPANNE